MARDKWTPETPWFDDGVKTKAYWPPYVCKNKSCKSYGKSHPNCHCRAPSFAQQSRNLEYDFSGGEVGRHFCMENIAHDPSCPHYADGGMIEHNTHFETNPSLALDHVILNHGLHHVLTKIGKTKSPDPNRIADDFLSAHKAGRTKLDSHHQNLHNEKADRIQPNKDSVAALKDHLQSLRENPQAALDVGGDLGKSFPTHSVHLAAKLGAASSYFDSIKPMGSQAGPMDKITPPNKFEEAKYNRQVAIAEHPQLIFENIKNGSVQPQDLQTLNAVYPELAKTMQAKMMDQLIEAKTKDKPIPYKLRRGMSAFLGQPLEYVQSPIAALSIMKANSAGAAAQSQTGKQQRSQKANKAAVEGSDKLAKLLATPEQSRQMERKI